MRTTSTIKPNEISLDIIKFRGLPIAKEKISEYWIGLDVLFYFIRIDESFFLCGYICMIIFLGINMEETKIKNEIKLE